MTKDLVQWCCKYEKQMIKTYFTNRFMQNKKYDRTVLLCFLCLDGCKYRSDWQFNNERTYDGCYNRRNERFDGIRILSSRLSMIRHLSSVHKVTSDTQDCFVDISKIVNAEIWDTAYDNYCRRNEKISSNSTAINDKDQKQISKNNNEETNYTIDISKKKKWVHFNNQNKSIATTEIVGFHKQTKLNCLQSIYSPNNDDVIWTVSHARKNALDIDVNINHQNKSSLKDQSKPSLSSEFGHYGVYWEDPTLNFSEWDDVVIENGIFKRFGLPFVWPHINCEKHVNTLDWLYEQSITPDSDKLQSVAIDLEKNMCFLDCSEEELEKEKTSCVQRTEMITKHEMHRKNINMLEHKITLLVADWGELQHFCLSDNEDCVEILTTINDLSALETISGKPFCTSYTPSS